MDVYLTEDFPLYQVWVDGRVYDSFAVRFGSRLTFHEELSIVMGYKEALLASERLEE